MPVKLLLVQNWGKMAHLPQPSTTGTLFRNFIYTTVVCMTTLHYHRLYQISNLEANLNLEDMKQLCVYRSHLHRYTYPKTNN